MARKHIGKRKKGGRKVVAKRPPAHKRRPKSPPVPRPSPNEVRMNMEGAAPATPDPPRGVVAPCRGFGENVATDISPIAD